MFNFLRKKVKKEDPILKEIDRQTEELKTIAESLLLNQEDFTNWFNQMKGILMGYSQELDKLKTKPRLKLISESKKIES